MLGSLFKPAEGTSWWLHVAGVVLICLVLFAALQLVPKQYRKYCIQAVTFLGGLYFALEFLWSTHPAPVPGNPKNVENFLTPYMESVTNWLVVIGAFTAGLGVINLSMVHFKRITRGGNQAFNSSIFFVSMFVMCVIGILKEMDGHANAINKHIYELLFSGALTTLDATMFSIIAFYIVSASYRAFRVRSTEATILLITAVIVMLGQIAVGQFLTNWIPRGAQANPLARTMHFEEVGSWILTLANAAAVRAISFGLAIGGLAVALRIWLGLERGSYFDSQS